MNFRGISSPQLKLCLVLLISSTTAKSRSLGNVYSAIKQPVAAAALCAWLPSNCKSRHHLAQPDTAPTINRPLLSPSISILIHHHQQQQPARPTFPCYTNIKQNIYFEIIHQYNSNFTLSSQQHLAYNLSGECASSDDGHRPIYTDRPPPTLHNSRVVRIRIIYCLASVLLYKLDGLMLVIFIDSAAAATLILRSVSSLDKSHHSRRGLQPRRLIFS